MTAIRRPEDIPNVVPLIEMIKRWSDAGSKAFMARVCKEDVVSEDLFAELAFGTAITRLVTVGQWCVVADLLRLAAVESWAHLGAALGMTEIEAHDRFLLWITGQTGLHRQHGRLGLSDAEANELRAMAEAVPL